MKHSPMWQALTLLAIVLGLIAGLPADTMAVAPDIGSPSDSTPQPIPFSQNWGDTSLISSNDNWSGVPGVVGHLGDGLASSVGTDPQTILVDGTSTPIDVIANQTNPDTLNAGGVAEFHLADPVVALQGSGSADAPFLLLNLITLGVGDVQVVYALRDLDGSTANAIQPVALHYRIGASGDFTNVPSAFIADATTGPSQATLVTSVSVTLPSEANDQPLVQLRIMTTDATSTDEWVGVDDLSITASPLSVILEEFDATPQPDHILVTWRTSSEFSCAGFNLYRSSSVSTPEALLGFVASQAPGGTQGASYAWQDFDVTSGQPTYYWLEEIDLAGATLLHGPVSATYQAPTGVGLIGMQAGGLPDRAKAWLAIPLALVLSVIGGLASRRVWR